MCYNIIIRIKDMGKENKDIRWQQRFINFKKAFAQLDRFIQAENLNEMEAQGLIKAFEYTYELAWKTLQDFIKEQGYENIIGPKPVIEQSFQNGYITDGKAWIRMHKSRNLATHNTYEENTAREIIEAVRCEFFYVLRDLKIRLEKEQSDNQHILFDE